jgi:hypothetical protein
MKALAALAAIPWLVAHLSAQTAFRLESSPDAKFQSFPLRDFESLTIEAVQLTERGAVPRIEVIYPESPLRRYQIAGYSVVNGPAEIYFSWRGPDDAREGAMILGTIRRTYRRTISPVATVELQRTEDFKTWAPVLTLPEESESGFYRVKVSPF